MVKNKDQKRGQATPSEPADPFDAALKKATGSEVTTELLVTLFKAQNDSIKKHFELLLNQKDEEIKNLKIKVEDM